MSIVCSPTMIYGIKNAPPVPFNTAFSLEENCIQNSSPEFDRLISKTLPHAFILNGYSDYFIKGEEE